MADNGSLSTLERYSLIATVVMVVLLSVLAWASAHYNWLLWLAASVGALGGLVHEIAQSGGKIVFFQKHDDGMYLGSVAGMILGAVAGLLVVRGHLTGSVVNGSDIQLSYEIFFAGLALKGVAEAAGGNIASKEPPPK